MTKKLSILILFFLSWALSAETENKPSEIRQSKPNILFIYTDDQSFNTIQELGNNEIHTPNLDRLVQHGTAFTNTYNMGSWSGAVCVASRTMILTGRHIWKAELCDDRAQAEQLVEKGHTWPQLMKQAGYETYISGKWHTKLKVEDIFDHVRNIRPGMPNQTPEGYQRPIKGQKDIWSPTDMSFEGFWKGGKHWSEVLADDAELFLKQASESTKPFFMYLAFNAPHDPRQAPQEFQNLYNCEELTVPKNFLPEYPYKQEMGCYMVEKKGEMVPLRDENLAPWPRTKYAAQTHKKEYYASISHLDTQIGRIVNALKASGMLENTFIFMTSDHGLACGSHGLMGKQNMYEHSMKPPLIVVGPTIEESKKIDTFVYLQDIMPTSLQLAGVALPSYVDFQSLLPLLDDPEGSKSEEQITYGAYKDFQRMIRVDEHKLIVYPKAKKVRLYNLKSDPYEKHDLAENSKYLPIMKKLFTTLQREQVKMNDPMKLDLSDFDFPQ